MTHDPSRSSILHRQLRPVGHRSAANMGSQRDRPRFSPLQILLILTIIAAAMGWRRC
jgi:hypothetical protein